MSRLRLGLSIGFVVLVLDHATKAWALSRLFFPPDRIEVLPILNFVPVWNRGVSFGLLASDSPYTPWLLGGFAVAVSIAMTVWMARATTPWLVIGLGFIVGGAIGNAIDRALHGAVVDFIDVHWADLHWPAFNIADASITIGVGLILLDAFVTRPGPDGDSRDGT
jgi:signal peptidase II